MRPSEIESLDYDIRDSTAFHSTLRQEGSGTRLKHRVIQWAVCAAIGLIVGLCAFLVDFVSEAVVNLKWHAAAAAAASHPVDVWAAAATHVIFCAALVSCSAALVVWLSPVAAGSGISEVKAYLQGVRVPMLLRTTTLVAKLLGVLCSVSAGLLIGKEGPMIHTGAIVAAGVSQGSSKTFRIRTKWLKRFRNDHEKRDFVSAGAPTYLSNNIIP